jgi:hypothetical protein
MEVVLLQKQEQLSRHLVGARERREQMMQALIEKRRPLIGRSNEREAT